MKKLFVSVPMRDRTEEQIRESIHRMHKAAEAMVGEKLELIDSHIEHTPPQSKHVALAFLGESIKKMADADYFAYTDVEYLYSGCRVEREAAVQYIGHDRMIQMNTFFVAPDTVETMCGETQANAQGF